MGRAGKWIRALLGIKKSDPPISSSSSPLSSTPTSSSTALSTPSLPKLVRNRWSFVKSYREKDPSPHRRSILPAPLTPPPPPPPPHHPHLSGAESNKRAIAVAAATAAVAEAAVAAAHAAAEVVRLTSSSGRSAVLPPFVTDAGEKIAALKIQAHFRAYLARRALRALRALVRLQALVRGNIVRKQTADMLKRMQTMLRVQERVRAVRAQISDSPPLSSSKSSLCPGPPTPEKFEHPTATKSKVHSFKHKRTGSNEKARFVVCQLEGGGMWDRSQQQQQPLISFGNDCMEMDGRMDRILEVESGDRAGTDISVMRRTLFHHSGSSGRPHIREADETSLCSGNSSPQLFSAFSRADSSRRGSLTPTMSDGPKPRTADHRNYMSCTESSRAKTRSVSAPRQRSSLQQYYERSASGKRDSSACSPGYSGWLHGFETCNHHM